MISMKMILLLLLFIRFHQKQCCTLCDKLILILEKCYIKFYTKLIVVLHWRLFLFFPPICFKMAVCLQQRDLSEAVKKCKVLVVGAGGIGCELIKNLVLTGFNNLIIVDLDTIDVSNLNRQFLFQKNHVGRPKVEVARESALLFNPNASITAIHDSILNPEYNVSFFKQFSLVMNALDNKKARNHVNRLCLAAGVTLIESGSAGYLGQVTVIRKGESECYECLPKPVAKTFPGCTIRNTPSEPIHCIVWAKHLYSQLFGEPDADNDVSPDTELIPNDEYNNDENMETLEKNEEGHDEVTHRLSTRTWMEANNYDSKKLLQKLFVTDIEYLLTMDKLWKTRKPPEPLSILTHTSHEESSEGTSTTLVDLRQWSIPECIDTFLNCIPALRERQLERKELIWDKDCDIDLDFVVASTNLRAHLFSIPLKSKFDIKSMAGNIIPAIATTNAVISGIIVMEALKVLAGEFNRCKTTYLPKHPNPRKHLLVTCPLLKPNPKCYVCSPRPEASVKLNTNTVTMRTLQDKILIAHFGMVAPDVEFDDGKGTILISSEEGETEENLPRTMAEFGINDGSRLKVDDFLQNYQLIINIIYSSDSYEDEQEFEVVSEDKFELQQNDKRRTRKRKASDNPVVDDSSKKVRLQVENDIETLED